MLKLPSTFSLGLVYHFFYGRNFIYCISHFDTPSQDLKDLVVSDLLTPQQSMQFMWGNSHLLWWCWVGCVCGGPTPSWSGGVNTCGGGGQTTACCVRCWSPLTVFCWYPLMTFVDSTCSISLSTEFSGSGADSVPFAADPSCVDRVVPDNLVKEDGIPYLCHAYVSMYRTQDCCCCRLCPHPAPSMIQLEGWP